MLTAQTGNKLTATWEGSLLVGHNQSIYKKCIHESTMLVQLDLIWSRSVMRTTIQSYLLCKGMHDIVGRAWASALSTAQSQATEWHKSTCHSHAQLINSTRTAQHRNCLVTYGQYRCCTLVQHMCSAKHKKAWKHSCNTPSGKASKKSPWASRCHCCRFWRLHLNFLYLE